MAKLSFDLIYEDSDLIAINKPSGMLTITDRENNQSLKERLQHHYPEIYTIHRIDKDTSGIILFARNADAHRYYSGIFEKREIKKYYLAVVNGCPHPLSGDLAGSIMEHPVKKGRMIIHRKGKEAHTGYETIEAHHSFSLVRFELFTGRTHQIRIHASDAGFPIACDSVYGNAQPIMLSSIKQQYKRSKLEEEEQPLLNRLALHAFQLSFIDKKGNLLQLEAPIPKSFAALMNQIKKWELKS